MGKMKGLCPHRMAHYAFFSALAAPMCELSWLLLSIFQKIKPYPTKMTIFRNQSKCQQNAITIRKHLKFQAFAAIPAANRRLA
jgi:hypothetical protein